MTDHAQLDQAEPFSDRECLLLQHIGRLTSGIEDALTELGKDDTSTSMTRHFLTAALRDVWATPDELNMKDEDA